MARQLVEVIDREGHVVHTYLVELPDADCHDAEYEEMALILAEKGGVVAEQEFIHLRARCIR
jgi:hypothetical protein